IDREAAGVSVVVAIDGSLLDRERSGHRRMNGTDESVCARVELIDVVGLGRDAWEDRSLEDLGAGRGALVDRDVVRNATVLVVEIDLERFAGFDREVRLLERDVLCGDLERLAAARAARCGGPSRGPRGARGAGRSRSAARGWWWRRIRLRDLVGKPGIELGRGHRLHVEEHRAVEGAAQLGALAAEGLAGVGGVNGEVEGRRPPWHDVSLEQELRDVERVDDVLRAHEELELDRPTGRNVHPAAVRSEWLELGVDSLVAS